VSFFLLSSQEIARLLCACDDPDNPDFCGTVVMALHPGMRRGEIVTLTMGKGDMKIDVITVATQKRAYQE
jgi:hypothetical protein